jgi:hypothetical protein
MLALDPRFRGHDENLRSHTGKVRERPMSNELRDKARALGLERLTDEHLAQLERATAGMDRHLQRLPRNIPAAQEPAHMYRAKGEIP